MPLSTELTQRLMHITELPSPPRIATEIIALAEDPELSLVQVAGVVNKDPALSAKVLRIANSPVYARRRKSDTLRQALLVLGLNATLTLALNFSLVTSLRRDQPPHFDFRGFWRRALLAATGARALAELLERRDAEELALAALLQDIGMLALVRVEPELYVDAPPVTQHAALADHERARLGADHAEVGVWLLERWQLSARLRAGVAAGHAPEAVARDSAHAEFALFVALSGMLADVWFAEDPAAVMATLSARAESLVGIDLTQLATVLALVRNQLPETETLYEIDLVTAAQAERILEHASELVLVRNLDVVQEAGRLRNMAQGAVPEQAEDGRIDPATGLYSRAYLEQCLAREVEAARTQHWPVSLICLHVDAVNSTLAMSAAQLLRRMLRDSDVLGRIGEQEFAIVLTGSTHEAAVAVSQRLIEGFRRAALNAGDGNVYLGMPIAAGVETLDATRNIDSADNLLRGATRAMHAAVRDGDPVPVSGFETQDAELAPPAGAPGASGLLARLFGGR